MIHRPLATRKSIVHLRKIQVSFLGSCRKLLWIKIGISKTYNVTISEVSVDTFFHCSVKLTASGAAYKVSVMHAVD